MEKKRYGEDVTLETRAESECQVNRGRRYRQITECLKERPEMTAKKIAVMMMKKGYIPTSERNFTSPRLTEMCQSGVVEPVGKKKCSYTGKRVTAFSLREGKANES